jgi:hypothetical protein
MKEAKKMKRQIKEKLLESGYNQKTIKKIINWYEGK